MDLGDVDLSDEDVARIDRLVDRADFTRREAEAIVRFSKTERAERDPEAIADFVVDDASEANDVFDGITEAECADLRRRMAGARRPSAVVSEYKDKHPSVIFRHAQGRCGHDIDQSATTSPRIRDDECRDMRVAFQQGDTVEDLRADFHRSANAVNRHVFGRCDHSFESDTKHAEVDESACASMRRAYRENTTATVGDIARAFIVASGTAHRHLRGECTHEPDEDPIASTFDGYIDGDECADMRRAFFSGLTCRRLADDVFDRDYQHIRKHVFGRCRHDHDVEPAEGNETSVTTQDCAYMRRAYKHETGVSVADLVDRFGVGKGTFYYHVFGNCTHEEDREPPATKRNKD